MAIFYHLSTNLLHTGEFFPRIPECRHKEQEDSIIPRLCVAPTIEDCLTAIPNGGSHLEETNTMLRGYYLVSRIDTDKLGISKEYIVPSKVLYEKDLVRDADITKEVWITTPTPFVVPEEDRFLIKLISWEETVHDVVPHSIYTIADEKFEGDYGEAYRNIYHANVPCSVGIVEAQYIHESVKKGEEISIYFDDDREEELIKSYVNKNYDMEIVSEFMDEITFVMNRNSNLRDLFLYHKDIINL